jgi:hypothetical protein
MPPPVAFFLCAVALALMGKTKVKLPLCLITEAVRHEDVWGSGCIDPRILDLGWMDVSGHLHTPAAILPLKEPLVLIL